MKEKRYDNFVPARIYDEGHLSPELRNEFGISYGLKILRNNLGDALPLIIIIAHMPDCSPVLNNIERIVRDLYKKFFNLGILRYINEANWFYLYPKGERQRLPGKSYLRLDVTQEENMLPPLQDVNEDIETLLDGGEQIKLLTLSDLLAIVSWEYHSDNVSQLDYIFKEGKALVLS